MPHHLLRLAQRLALGAIVAFGTLWFSGLAPSPAFAQQPVSAEERRRQHEQRVREIIERRRQQRLEQESAGTEQPDDQADSQQDAPPPPAAGEPVDTSGFQLGTMILYNRFRNADANIYELDTVVRRGERFVSEVVLQNGAGQPFDRIQLALNYDKRFLRPVRIFDSTVRGSAAGDPVFEKNERDSVLTYDITFADTRVSKELVILQIVWEAIRPTEYTGLGFEFPREGVLGTNYQTAVMHGSDNVLGDVNDPVDGVLTGSLLVLQPLRTASRPQVKQGKKEELRSIYLDTVGSDVPVGLQLAGPNRPLVLGEEFDVDVILNNPFGAIVDSLRFFAVFDPTALQVVDHDRGNWIRNGVNVHDGSFRSDYPFDFHKRNEVDNDRGLIAYSKALGSQLALPTGTFARIRFRAIAPVESTAVEFVGRRQGAGNVTAVRSFGFDLFSADPLFTTPVYEARIVSDEGELPTHAAQQFERDTKKKTQRSLLVLETIIPPPVPEHLQDEHRL